MWFLNRSFSSFSAAALAILTASGVNTVCKERVIRGGTVDHASSHLRSRNAQHNDLRFARQFVALQSYRVDDYDEQGKRIR